LAVYFVQKHSHLPGHCKDDDEFNFAHGLKTKRSSVAKMGKSIELERRHYYRKAVGLMTTGVAIFGLGIAFGVLYFLNVKERRNLLMAGPICLAVGLLVFICGLVWIPIIKTKLKKKIQQQKNKNSTSFYQM